MMRTIRSSIFPEGFEQSALRGWSLLSESVSPTERYMLTDELEDSHDLESLNSIIVQTHRLNFEKKIKCSITESYNYGKKYCGIKNTKPGFGFEYTPEEPKPVCHRDACTCKRMAVLVTIAELLSHWILILRWMDE